MEFIINARTPSVCYSRIKLGTIHLFFLIFFSNDTYLFGTNSNELIVSIPRYFMLMYCSVSLLLLLGGKIRFDSKISTYLIMLISFVLVSTYHHEVFSRVVIKILYMSAALAICISYKLDEYVDSFMNCITVFSVFAILLTGVAYIAPSAVRHLPSMINTVGIRFYSIGLAGLDERSVGQLAVRTGGIFWEPGVFQMYLNLAILFELMLYQGTHRRRLLIYITALILTFSTTGYLAFAWITGTYVLFEKITYISFVNKLRMLITLVVAGTVGVYLLFHSSIGDVVFGKLFDMGHGSTMPRLASIVTNLEIFRDHPFAGIGMDIMESEFIRRTMASSLIRGWTHQNTNTMLYQFAAHGMFFGIPFAIGTYQFGGKLTDKLVMKISIFIMILMLYIGENLMTSLLPYILIYYGFTSSSGIKYTKLGKEYFDIIYK